MKTTPKPTDKFEKMELANGSTATYLIPHTQPNPEPVIIDRVLLKALLDSVDRTSKEHVDKTRAALIEACPEDQLVENLAIFNHSANEVLLMEDFRRCMILEEIQADMQHQIEFITNQLGLK